MKKIIFLSTIFPRPIDTGKKVVISGIIDYLIDKNGVNNIHYILLGNSDDYINAKKNSGLNITFIQGISSIKKLINGIIYSLFLKKKSFQEAFFYSKDIKEQLIALINQEKPDIVIVDTLRVSQFLDNAQLGSTRIILYMEDLFSIRYNKMIEVIKVYKDINTNPLGSFQKFVPTLLKNIITFKPLQLMLLNLEQRLIKDREYLAPHKYPECLLINQQEVAFLKKATQTQNVKMIKPLLNSVAFKPRSYLGAPTFVFLGALNLPQNDISLVHFIQTQLNSIIKTIPDFKLRIIGKTPSLQLLRLVEKNKNSIVLEGYVEDLSDVFVDCAALVIPLLFGSGVKLKTLEAFARGVPVISTSFGVEGINVKSGVDCVITDNLNEFGFAMYEIMNVEKNSSISQMARKLYIEEYSKEAIYKHYDELFDLPVE